jgi:hypothetical protein
MFPVFGFLIFRSPLYSDVHCIQIPSVTFYFILLSTQICKLHDKEISLTSKDNDSIFEHLKTSPNAEGSRLRYNEHLKTGHLDTVGIGIPDIGILNTYKIPTN